MPKHSFSDIVVHYPEIVEDMPDTFTSHQFILRLAHKHQGLYVEALYAYRDATHRGTIAPFRVVHQILSQRLHDFVDDLIIADGKERRSKDIFGHTQGCLKWRKLK